MKQVNLRLPEALLSQVMEVKGNVSREEWIRQAVRMRLNQIRHHERERSRERSHAHAR